VTVASALTDGVNENESFEAQRRGNTQWSARNRDRDEKEMREA